MVEGGFFSPIRGTINRGKKKEDNQFFSAAKNPLSPIGSDDYKKEVEGFIQDFKDDFNYRNKYDVDTGERKDKYGRPIPGERFGEEEMRRDYPFRRQYRYENWDGEKYTPGVPFGKAETDTKLALGGDNLGSFGAIGGALGVFGLGLKGIQSAVEGGKRLKENIEQRVNPEKNKVSLGDRVGSFFNTITGTQPVAAGTLEGKPTRFAAEADPTPRPKLDYVNPDRTIMTGSEIRDAFRPSNIFGYKDKFGRYKAAVDRDRQETINRVAQRYSSMPAPDDRSIAQIRADRAAKMKTDAEARQKAFKETGIQTFGGQVQPRKSADVTYNTNMYSNPAFGFRDKMSPEDQKKYDASARYATLAAKPDPSLGNVLTSFGNVIKKALPKTPFTRQASLESIGERQMRLAGIEVNRPAYQKEAYARKFLGISPQMLQQRNMNIIRQDAAARYQRFKNERAEKALIKAAKRLGGNLGTGKDGSPGLGTQGKSLPSNPKGFSGYSRRSTPGTGTGTSPSRSRPGSKKASRGSSPGSRSRGGTGTGGSKAKASGSRGQGGGTASRSKGGSFGGSRRSTNTSKSRRRCDIRTKVDIAPLTNPDLIRDDLANVAYFVKEIK